MGKKFGQNFHENAERGVIFNDLPAINTYAKLRYSAKKLFFAEKNPQNLRCSTTLCYFTLFTTTQRYSTLRCIYALLGLLLFVRFFISSKNQRAPKFLHVDSKLDVER
jgi:hypothetical protein